MTEAEDTESEGQAAVADDKNKLTNQINPETGQFDARFVLWRTFCDERGIPVETLPSDLQGEARDQWEKLKNERLHKPTEEGNG